MAWSDDYRPKLLPQQRVICTTGPGKFGIVTSSELDDNRRLTGHVNRLLRSPAVREEVLDSRLEDLVRRIIANSLVEKYASSHLCWLHQRTCRPDFPV